MLLQLIPKQFKFSKKRKPLPLALTVSMSSLLRKPLYFQYIKTSFCLLAFLSIALSSCKGKKEAVSKEIVTTTTNKYENHNKGTVTKFDVDGCSFLITLESGKRLNPINLDDEFKKEGLKIFITYISQNDIMTTCMAGEVVKITDIVKR